MLKVDLRRDRFMKVWRVIGDRTETTAAVLRRRRGFTAVIHRRYPDGRSKVWYWRSRRHRSRLTAREVVLCITSMEQGLRALPGIHLRIDFPQGSSPEDQMIILMEYGLSRLVPKVPEPTRELEEDFVS